LKTSNAGPGRQIYDRNYYHNLLKGKNAEIMNEINKMKSEVEEINKDNQTYMTFERKYETLIKDVRKYEGELADYNLALDKYRSDTKPEDIEALFMHIKNQNDKQRQHLDKVFAEKRDMENEISNIEQQIQDINMANESKLNDLDPEQRNEYERLKEENGGLQGEINRSRTELEEVNSRLIQAESRLKQDTLKQRAQHLKEERASLLKRKDDLELQTNEMNLPFPEARERLLNRIKQDNAEIKQQEKDVADVRKMIETYQRNIKEIEQDLQEKKSGATSAGGEDGEAQKYEILYQKEREISEFMEKFEEDKTTYEGQINEHQTTIAALLEHMQRTMIRQNNLPSAAQYKDKKDELAFKQGQVENAETTYARLKVELE
jgi:intraflagellar transport protein 74